ncbi:glycoside hydrolase [Chloropicon primus]|uniref:Glycoside hydrolase n=1 Tax=Chloropicon primus TaxID=1764295 RepID=A0A5B8MIK0_9CHLO|nr:glycoside hydrolase [Chloropicon primus]UPQ98421.1 glycoside hydrolase [Chloropicon primus]|eukprot:QDZ19212.1 glycoside hydrolase [Chloropicon primus]
MERLSGARRACEGRRSGSRESGAAGAREKKRVCSRRSAPGSRRRSPGASKASSPYADDQQPASSTRAVFSAIASAGEGLGAVEARDRVSGTGNRESLRVRYVPDEENSWIEVSSEATRLRVKNDGRFELWGKCERNREVLCCSGVVTLPGEVAGRVELTYSFADLKAAGGSPHTVVVRWADYVTLVIHPPGTGHGPHGDWSKGLTRGFILEKYISTDHAEMTEIKIDVDSAGHWFGGAHFMNQLWPLNKVSWETGPFYPFDHGPTGLNTLVAPQFVTSSGLLVMVDPDTPFLHIGMNGPEEYHNGKSRPLRKWGTGVQNATNPILPEQAGACKKVAKCDGVLRIQSRKNFVDDKVSHTWSNWAPVAWPHSEGGSTSEGGEGPKERNYLKISLALCAFSNVRESSMASLKTLPRPKVTPNLHVLQDPIWTTWAKYKQWVTEGKVLTYAKEIKDSGLDYSVMEIDDRWQISYGDLDFDPGKFPDPKGMVEQLHEMGFKVTLWVMPFVEKRSAAFKEGREKGYFVKRVTSACHPYEEQPGFFKWWNLPSVVALDVTNPEAVDWYVSRLRRLQDLYGIDGFKFDGGEPCFLPKNPITSKALSYPSEYTHLWVKEVAGKFQGGVCEVRTGHKTQDVGIMTRIGDRFSTWDFKNGLQSIIPTVLTSGLLGYPFALPDIIGGNAYFGRKPDTELFVRWTQVNALMPAMQFSIAPWHIGKEAQDLVSQAMKLRKKFVGDIIGLAGETSELLKPIVRPMWWLDPGDEATYEISDQFALGDDIVVAPVVVKGQRKRDVYLTAGVWEDLDKPGERIQGGQWLLNLDAPLAKLPCFRRIHQEEA